MSTTLTHRRESAVSRASFLRYEAALIDGRVHGTPAISFALGVNGDGEAERLHFYAQPGVPHITLTGDGTADATRALLVQLAGNNGPAEARVNVLGTDTTGDIARMDIVDGVVAPHPTAPIDFLEDALALTGRISAEIERRLALFGEFGVADVHDARQRALQLSMRDGHRTAQGHPLNLPYSIAVIEASALAATPDDAPEVLSDRVRLMWAVTDIAQRGGDAGVLVVLVADDLRRVPAAIIERTHVVRLGGDARPYAQFTLAACDTAQAIASVQTRYRA